MLCLAHEGEPRGHVTLNGRAATVADIAGLARCTVRECERLLAELEQRGVFSRTEDGTIYSRRMVRDTDASNKGRAEVAKRWGGSGPSSPPNRVPTREPNSLEAEADTEAERESSLRSLSPRARGDAPKQRAMPPALRLDDAQFEQFWQAYPRREGKGAARKAWKTAVSKAEPTAIIEAATGAKWPDNPRFIPHPATWLNQERWLDERPRDAVLAALDLDADEAPILRLQ